MLGCPISNSLLTLVAAPLPRQGSTSSKALQRRAPKPDSVWFHPGGRAGPWKGIGDRVVRMALQTADIVEITQVIHLYGHLLDGRLWDRLGDVFTPDCVFDMSLDGGTDVGGRRFVGLAELRAAFEVVDHAAAHHSSNVFVDAHGDETRSLCKFFMPDTKGRLHTGEYADLLVRTEAGWRIKHRVVKERRCFDPTATPWTLLGADLPEIDPAR